jgi:hypothetical protein
VVWVARTGSTWALRGRILSAAGKPIGGQITILSNWAGIALDPTIFANGSTRVVAFGGSKTGISGPYDTNAEYYTTSPDGKTWTLQPGTLSADDQASNGGTAVTNHSGTFITAFARGAAVSYHVGTSASDPAPGPDPTTASTGNFSGSPGLGTDLKTNDVWALWSSDSGINGQDGVNAQPIYPTKGSRIHAPGSSSPTLHSQGVQQDLSAASRVGGGIYTAYRTPKNQSIDVWKVGASKPLATINTKHFGAAAILLTPAPQGRLWLFWSDANGWRATRSNKAATRFGPVTVAKPPHNDLQNLFIAGVGSAGPLEAVATMTTSTNVNELIARQFLPRLSIAASPHSVARGHAFTATVTDAGDAVQHATVHFDGAKATTNKKGKATFKVSHKAPLGKSPVTVSSGGYAGASTSVTVTK